MELAVLVIECRLTRPAVQVDLVKRLHGLVRKEIGIECKIELVPRNGIRRTTSGKLSRSAMRTDYLKRLNQKPWACRTLKQRASAISLFIIDYQCIS